MEKEEGYKRVLRGVAIFLSVIMVAISFKVVTVDYDNIRWDIATHYLVVSIFFLLLGKLK